MSLFGLFKPRKKPRKSGRPRGQPKLTGDGGTDDFEPPAAPTARKRGAAKKKSISWKREAFRHLFLPTLLLIGAGVVYIIYDLPSIRTLGDFRKAGSITVKTEDGTVIGTYGDVYGQYVPYAQIPKFLIDAVVATEDRNFFHHFGVDPIGLMRATYVNIRARHLVQGGSTITQQLAKNVFLTPDRTLKRKLQEMILAVELERKFSKADILTLYLNRVYMGAGNYGVDAASRRYFGHPVKDITMSEAAILVGLLKAPSRYAPTSNPDLSERRATQVLINMKNAGYLTDAQVATARDQFDDEDANYRDSHGFGAFYFSDYVVSQLPDIIGNASGDIVVTTTLNPQWQRNAEDAVTDVIAKRGKAVRASQAALLALSPDGAIRAMVGGRNYRVSQFNRVTQGLRQPGSSFKLFVYLAALEAGYTPDSQMEDKPISVGNWRPRDYTGHYKGMMTLRDAFAESINSIAVQLSEAVGRAKVVEMAERLGITSELTPDPSIALGTKEATLYDMTRAYTEVAAEGRSVYPYAVQRVETTDGKILFERKPGGAGGVLSEAVVHKMNAMLSAVVTSGTGKGAQIGRPVVGKTGTTSDYRDAWFIGFVPQLTAGVWVGNDDTSPMKKVSGGSLPASIWKAFMAASVRELPVQPIPMDSGGGFLPPWLGGSPTTPPGAFQPQGNASPRQQQSQPLMPGGQSAPLPVAVPPPAPAPEDEPTPDYNAPPSFWDRLGR